MFAQVNGLVLGVAAVALLAACGTDKAQGPPDVRGQSAVEAVTHLRAAGYERIRFIGQRDSHPIGTILSQHVTAGRVRLVASMGVSPGRMVILPGISTCQLYPERDPLCAGGPVGLVPAGTPR
jgi:hypothetical protein